MAEVAQSWLREIPNLFGTGQARRRIQRHAQFSKFFAYQLLWEPLSSGGVGSRQSFTVDSQVAWFEVHRIARVADNLGAKVIFQSTPSGQQFSTYPHFLSHYGDGPRPTRFTPPLIFPRNGIITGVADDRQTVAANDNIRIAFLGAKVFTRPLVEERFYAYSSPFFYPGNLTANDGGTGPIAANQSGTVNVLTDSDSDFDVERITVLSDGPCTVQIRSGGDNWFDAPMRGELLGGSTIETPDLTPGEEASGRVPFILPAPRLITGGSYIAVTVTDASGNSNRVEVGFWGRRLYPTGGVGGGRRAP